VIDNRTSGLNLPLPNVANALQDDVGRITSAFTIIDGAVIAREQLANKNQSSGYCGLDSGGKVAAAQLPTADSITEGSTNKYFTSARALAAIPAATSASAGLVKLSSAITVDGGGALVIGSGAVGSSNLAVGAVTSGIIAGGSVTSSALATGAVVASAIASNAVTASAISSGAVGSNALATSAVTSTAIAGGAVISSALAAGSVTSGAIASAAVTSSAVASGAIVASALATNAVTATVISGGAVTSAALATGAVTSGALAAGAVVKAAIGADVAFPSVRQTVCYGATTNGAPSMLAAGSGLALNLSATAKPMKINFAAGNTDYVSTLSADATGVVSSLPASNTSYITTDYSSAAAVTWGATKAPPQYGFYYNRAAQVCLSLNNKSTDDFGNAWTLTSVTFSNTSPAISGTYMGVFSTSSSAQTNDFVSMPGGSWAMRCKVKPSALPTSGQDAQIVATQNAGGYGAVLAIYNASGTTKFTYWLSSNGTSFDIASAAQGTTTPVNGTSYDVELTFDSVAGVYRLYVNGVQEASTTSALKVCAITNMNLGGSPFAGSIQGVEFLPYCVHPAGTTFTPPTALPDVTVAGYASDWFSVPDMTMYKVSGASSVSGTNPTFTAVNRVYVGQVNTGASSVSSVINYALNGEYVSDWTIGLAANAALVSKNHYLGLKFGINAWVEIENIGTNLGYINGVIVRNPSQSNGTYAYPTSVYVTENTAGFAVGSSGWSIVNASTGAPGTPAAANWKYRLVAKRDW
jgi:hypothetical protein